MTIEGRYLKTGHPSERIPVEMAHCYKHGDWCEHCFTQCPDCYTEGNEEHVTEAHHEIGGEGA